MTREIYLKISFIFMSIAVGLGAIGAHALGKTLEPKYIQTFETGVKYFIYHAFGLMLLSSFDRFKKLVWCRHLIFIGIIFFCGNCIIYGVTQIKFFAMIVPIGGLSFIFGWLTGFFELTKD